MFIRELADTIQNVRGIGPASARDFAQLNITTIADLLLLLPRGYEDRQKKVPLSAVLKEGGNSVTVNTVARVIAHDYIGWGAKKTLKVFIEDDTAAGALVCFGRNFLARKLVQDEHYRIYGKFSYQYNEIQSSTFDFEPASGESHFFGRILPVYPQRGNLTSPFIRKIIHSVIESHGKYVDNELPEKLLERRSLACKADTLRNIHFPETRDSVYQARKSLIYEELFYLQLTMARKRREQRLVTREIRHFDGSLAENVTRSLPFELTPDQKKVCDEIRNDLSSSTPMSRLLQGDVGSGKTLVALLSALLFAENGMQTALMAPTELLAQQHADKAADLLGPFGVRTAFLSGTLTGGRRKELLLALESGEIDLIIGTHALFSRDVIYKNLAFVIVDEQHRFGVLQRYALASKAENPDILLMTATPIPRSLALTIFGELDISSIRTMPSERKPVVTHLAQMGKEEKVYQSVRRELEQGHQAYFVYPLIGESEKMDLKDAETMYEFLKREIFPGFRTGMIHSRVDNNEKYSTMKAFSAGDLDILVATSVVEVGVDVPNATCMVIEHADRFGLSALHQLRGRVGRGSAQSYAFLVYGENLTEDGKQRMKVMKESSDGFYISEEDLKIRGAGNVAGTTQSGFFQFQIADPLAHMEILLEARDDVREIMENDPGLLEPEHEVIREVLEKAPPFSNDLVNQG